jgi:hypothetical protein
VMEMPGSRDCLSVGSAARWSSMTERGAEDNKKRSSEIGEKARVVFAGVLTWSYGAEFASD